MHRLCVKDREPSISRTQTNVHLDIQLAFQKRYAQQLAGMFVEDKRKKIKTVRPQNGHE